MDAEDFVRRPILVPGDHLAGGPDGATPPAAGAFGRDGVDVVDVRVMAVFAPRRTPPVVRLPENTRTRLAPNSGTARGPSGRPIG